MIVIHSEPNVTPDMIAKRVVRRARDGIYLWSDLSAGGKLLRRGRCYGSELPATVKEEADKQVGWPGYVDWK